jgi:glycosyltransferase involved in cell wall biosynthesis
MIVIGPTLLCGIGQHAKKYTQMFEDATYHLIGSELPESDHGLIFTIPIKQNIEYIKYAKTRVKNLACMTVCETETVHEDYGLIMNEFKRVAVPSEFCKRVLSKQFPHNEFYVVHAHIPQPPPKPYTFYHIGNIMDDRKNFRSILEAFVRLNKPDTRLVVKATCNQPVEIKLPNVEVINGLISDEEMDKIHNRCDCYVSFSKSEGVGMGPVEAALRDKPVIITNYGGSPEYVKTPYTIDCELQELERDDFLFKKGMTWGKPNPNQLLEFMEDAYNKKLRYMDHEHTKNLVGKENILQEFILNVIGTKDDKTDEDSTTH